MEPNIRGYLESWSEELRARQNRIRLLIGNAHWLTDGHHKEAIVREFLGRYMPTYLLISRGFIRPPASSDRCSPEVDILIADSTRQPPFFNEGGVIIVPPSAVLGFFEIKTKYDRGTLRDAIASVSATQKAIEKTADARRIWRCICFFDHDNQMNLEKATALLSDELTNLYAQEKAKNGEIKQDSELFPTCIVVVSQFVAFIRRDDSRDYCSIKIFGAKDLSLPCAFADMFAGITSQISGTNVNELDQIVESFPIGKPTIISIKA